MKQRPWVENFIPEWRKKLAISDTSFLLHAAPAAGKTRASLRAFQVARELGLVNYLLIVAPNRTICEGFAQTAAEVFGCSISTILPAQSGLHSHIPGYITPVQRAREQEVIGFATTYAMLATLHGRMYVAGLCERYKVMVVIDEVHHLDAELEEESGWSAGAAVLRSAAVRLMMTGTPFRSNRSPIPFVTYDANGIAIPDYSYTWKDATADGVIRPVVFPVSNAEVTWEAGGNVVTAQLGDDLDDRDSSRALRTATMAESAHVRTILEKAHAKLLEIRRKKNCARAGGIIITRSIEESAKVAAVVESITGAYPIVVHSDTPGVVDEIARFSASTDPWIVSVDMLSEGVDIPRATVGVYLSNKRTRLYIMQCVGRCTRTGAVEHPAYWYIPNDPQLRTIVSEIMQEIAEAALLRSQKPIGPGGGGGGNQNPSGFRPLSADGDVAEYIHLNDAHGSEHWELAEHVAESIHVTDPAQIAAIAKALEQAKAKPAATTGKAAEPIDKEKARRAKAINDFAKEAASRFMQAIAVAYGTPSRFRFADGDRTVIYKAIGRQIWPQYSGSPNKSIQRPLRDFDAAEAAIKRFRTAWSSISTQDARDFWTVECGMRRAPQAAA